MLHSAATAERLVRADVMAARPADYPRGTRLFFINLPFFAAEVGPALRNATDRPDLEVYPLTFSPDLFYPNTGIVVEQEDDRTVIVRSRGAAFFGGEFGDRVQLGLVRDTARATRATDRMPCSRRGRCRFGSKSSRRT